MSEEENKNLWQSSEFWTEKGFLEEYRKHRTAMQHVAECAKIYIMENWQKVDDWTGLNLVIKCKQGRFEFYNYTPKLYGKRSEEDRVLEFDEGGGNTEKDKARKVESSIFNKIMKKIDEESKDKHNPIKEIKGFVLDPTDGDFSVTINGQELWWINEEAVIEIANWIEKKLNGDGKA